MTGGIAFILDETNELDLRVNKGIVEMHDLTTLKQEKILQDLIQEHIHLTSSQKAKDIISDWSYWKKLFKLIVPPSEKNKLGIDDVLVKAHL